jgi:hypothetical protein
MSNSCSTNLGYGKIEMKEEVESEKKMNPP